MRADKKVNEILELVIALSEATIPAIKNMQTIIRTLAPVSAHLARRLQIYVMLEKERTHLQIKRYTLGLTWQEEQRLKLGIEY